MTTDLSATGSALPQGIYDTVRPFVSRSLFWKARYLQSSSASEYLPFLFWLVEVSRPNIVFSPFLSDGVGYFGICQGVASGNPDAQCIALIDADTEESLREYNEKEYEGFSQLLPASADLSKLANGSVDLLYLDLSDPDALELAAQQNWTTKLSNRAVVIFLGVQESALRASSADMLAGFLSDKDIFSFEFGKGLSVVLHGDNHDERLRHLCTRHFGAPGYRDIQTVFQRLGKLHVNEARLQDQRLTELSVQKALPELQEKLTEAEALNAKLTQEVTELRKSYDQRSQVVANLQARFFDQQAEWERRSETQAQTLNDQGQALSEKSAQLTAATQQIAVLEKSLADTNDNHTRAIESATEAFNARLQAQTNKAAQEEHDYRLKIAEMDAEAQTQQAIIRQNEEETAQRFHEIARLTQLLETREGELHKLTENEAQLKKEHTAELMERDQQLQSLKSEIQTQKSIIRQNEEETAQRFHEIAHLTRLLETKESEQHKLTENEAQLKKEHAAALLERDQKIRDLTSKTQTQHFKILQAEKDIEQRFHEIVLLTRALEDNGLSLIDSTKAASEPAPLTAPLTKPETLATESIETFTLTAPLPARKKSLRLDQFKRYIKPGDTRRQINLIRNSPMFDTQWYLNTYEDIKKAGVDPAKHYLLSGANELRDPGPNFCTRAYYSDNTDVAQAGLNPLIHFELYGRTENRKVKPSSKVPEK